MFAPFRWLAGVVAVLATVSAADAAVHSLIFGPGGEFSGGGVTTLSGTVTVTFTDLGSGEVELKIDTNGLDAGADERITGLYLNFDESAGDLSTGEFSHVSGNNYDTIDITNTRGSESGTTFKADGDGFFNILLAWNNAPTSSLLADSVVIYNITNTAFDAEDFINQLSVDGADPLKNGFSAALRVISVGDQGEESGFFAPQGEVIPEPTSIIAWLVCTSGLGLVLRSRMKKNAA
ncbi:MAG TPA: hypothetical protein VMP01_07460 [Pirellulaceae bacterium]|nr:hypothetical protein [Pirellulaceae bacterium]